MRVHRNCCCRNWPCALFALTNSLRSPLSRVPQRNYIPQYECPLMLSRQLLPLVDIAGARRDKLNVGGGGRVPCLADNFIITVAVAQLAERQVVVLDVAGSSPVGHP